MSDTTIAGRVALVSGAGRGIGRALTEALLARGARRVYAGARKPEALATLAAKFGERVVVLPLDITNPAQVEAAAARATDVDLLINNAGVVEAAGAAFEDPKQLAWSRREMEVNVEGTFRMTQAFAPVLARNGGGTIVNIVSVAALANFPFFLSYSLSKAALHSLTQGTRHMLKSQGTSVLGVYPGPVDTEMATELELDKASPDDVARAILDGVETGLEEVLPDAMAKEVGAVFFRDPKALERQFGATGAAV